MPYAAIRPHSESWVHTNSPDTKSTAHTLATYSNFKERIAPPSAGISDHGFLVPVAAKAA